MSDCPKNDPNCIGQEHDACGPSIPIPVANILGYTIYATRTEGGGIQYWDDSCGIICRVVDMTTARRDVIRLILDIDNTVNEKFEIIQKNHLAKETK